MTSTDINAQKFTKRSLKEYIEIGRNIISLKWPNNSMQYCSQAQLFLSLYKRGSSLYSAI